MADAIVWDDLLRIYQHTRWIDSEIAIVEIADDRILQVFNLVETSDRAAIDANLAALVDIRTIQVGNEIKARVGPPRLALGVLADNWDALLLSPDARTKEPQNYFIKEDRSHSKTAAATTIALAYRSALQLVQLFAKAALFLDVPHSTLVYFKEKKIEIPINFKSKDLRWLDQQGIDDLKTALEGEFHEEQRLSIFSDAVVSFASSQSRDNRFLYLAQNVSELARRVKDGYQLFASSFSYTKIRGEVENAQSEYLNKIHKTFVDIQGQLLGLPVATVVVATQLKAVSACGVEAWANLAIVCGAWLFATLLIASCANQWITLRAIKSDIRRQKQKLLRDFVDISHQFTDIFGSLDSRIVWHQGALLAIGVIAIAGAIFATIVFNSVTKVNIFSLCL
ncbi:hypothetical protein J2X76_003795 [Neorhizobium sp. 2083]|uniref:hypothetical protein n=1 Tax=Neorhizobium sp. 2083 TaxID=2817762 RepID=UPI0028580D89|nr:hypothetical protein [Neorhizobium sp. 2083]MDR6818618.1 hypothetical protein [Neorhizobium sp. 2083]